MIKKIFKNPVSVAVIIAGIILAGAVVFASIRFTSKKQDITIIPPDKIGPKIVDFINQKLLRGRATASLVGVKKESGVYKITIKIQNNEIDTYATLDGKFLYPDAIDVEKVMAQADENNENTPPAKKTCDDIKKADKPLMEAFVVSQCPFGLQMERILAEIQKNIPALASQIKVRYMGSIVNNEIQSMHGKEEAEENLRQICIREEQPDKFWSYVSCYIKGTKSEECLKQSNVNTKKLEACISDNSRGLKYAKEDFDLDKKYKVSGSPTLILNGEKVSEFDFGGRTAEAVKKLLCCGYKNQPKECSKELTTDPAAVGFSKTYSSSSKSQGSHK